MKILAIGAHPDDIELGAGGTLFKYTQSGTKADALVMTLCQDEVPKGWNPRTLRYECIESMKQLGVNVSFQNYDNKQLERNRQSILDLLYEMRDGYDLVFCPSSFNSNQDHITVYNEVKRAFRSASILGYQTPSSDFGFSQNAIYSSLSMDAVNAKVKALSCYKSQLKLKKPYFAPEFTMALMKVAGIEIWKDYAEKFETIRFVMS